MEKLSANPYEAADLQSGNWSDITLKIAANTDAAEGNTTILERWTKYGTLFTLGPALLPGSPNPHLTGLGTATWTLKAGTRLSIPIGSFGAYTGCIPVILEADVTQGMIPSDLNWVYARLNTTTGLIDLVVNNTGTRPANALFVGKGEAGGSSIKEVTLRKINYMVDKNAQARCSGLFVPGFSIPGGFGKHWFAESTTTVKCTESI